MKSAIASLLFIISLTLGFYAYAGCGQRACGKGQICDYYQTKCQCTDPACSYPSYTNCISRGYCCKAFGNIGAR